MLKYVLLSFKTFVTPKNVASKNPNKGLECDVSVNLDDNKGTEKFYFKDISGYLRRSSVIKTFVMPMNVDPSTH